MIKTINSITYYKVLFYDGDIDIELFPDEDEDYDNTDLKQVKKYAKNFDKSRIIRVTEEEVQNNK